MKIKLFTIPIYDYEEGERELNKFLESNQIEKIDKHFYSYSAGAVWCLMIEYEEKRLNSDSLPVSNTSKKSGKVDYKTTLSEKHFEIFSKLREARKKIANEEAIPAYAVFTDAELARIAELDSLTEEQIRTVKGVGEKKAEKFARRIIVEIK